ncbi:MAG: hypothetical protein EZS28_001409, partial [Streblomastix strix]
MRDQAIQQKPLCPFRSCITSSREGELHLCLLDSGRLWAQFVANVHDEHKQSIIVQLLR